MTAFALTVLAAGAEQTALTVWHAWMWFCACLVLLQLVCVIGFLGLVFTPQALRNRRWHREQEQARAEIGDDTLAMLRAPRWGGFDGELARMVERMKEDGSIG